MAQDVRRISISVKVDYNSEEYNNFICSLKDTNQLSTFVINCLFAYYHSEDMRTALEAYINQNSPLSAVLERIEQINELHARNMALMDYTENTVSALVNATGGSLAGQGGTGVSDSGGVSGLLGLEGVGGTVESVGNLGQSLPVPTVNMIQDVVTATLKDLLPDLLKGMLGSAPVSEAVRVSSVEGVAEGVALVSEPVLEPVVALAVEDVAMGVASWVEEPVRASVASVVEPEPVQFIIEPAKEPVAGEEQGKKVPSAFAKLRKSL